MAMYSTNICSPRSNRSNGERFSHSFHSSGNWSNVIFDYSRTRGACLSRQPKDSPGNSIASVCRCDAVEAEYLLGSATIGRRRKDSDVDVAILPRHCGKLSGGERLALTGELPGIFQRPVDLGVLSTANVVSAREAVAKGWLLFERDPQVTAQFAMLALSMEASLQEARREVLRAYPA